MYWFDPVTLIRGLGNVLDNLFLRGNRRFEVRLLPFTFTTLGGTFLSELL